MYHNVSKAQRDILRLKVQVLEVAVTVVNTCHTRHCMIPTDQYSDKIGKTYQELLRLVEMPESEEPIQVYHTPKSTM